MHARTLDLETTCEFMLTRFDIQSFHHLKYSRKIRNPQYTNKGRKRRFFVVFFTEIIPMFLIFYPSIYKQPKHIQLKFSNFDILNEMDKSK